MAEVQIDSTVLGNSLSTLLTGAEIQPGDSVSYQMCKAIYEFHPLGAKMVDGPINIAQSQAREIKVADDVDSRIAKAFNDEWKALNCTNLVFNTMVLSRIYGIASIALGAQGVPPNRPIDYRELPRLKIFFNVLDPLNTSGSLVMDQNPNSPFFQKHVGFSVAGVPWHPSRACVILHGEPIYISYTTSGFGFVGRSVYQRALYPLKTFIISMKTDDLVIRKCGVLVAMMRQAGSAVDNIMAKIGGLKRNVVKEAETTNVISIGMDESVESLDMHNADTAMKQGRTNVLENIAVAADMPAKLLNSETFAEGFGEGTEDAKMLVRYIDGVREEMEPVYEFLTKIVQYRAWTPEFYASLVAEGVIDSSVSYIGAFYNWTNSFTALWPTLLIEPESKQVEVEKIKFDSITKFLEMALTSFDPENRAIVLQWAADNFNESKHMFSAPLVLDYEALKAYTPPDQTGNTDEGGQSEKPASPAVKKAA